MEQNGWHREVDAAVHALGRQWEHLAWEFREVASAGSRELVSQWQGNPEDDIMVAVFEGERIHEPYHSQDFFFVDYAWHGSYDALSADEQNQITVSEGDCYVGQPHSGYALRGEANSGIVMVGVHIKRDAFFREYLPALAGNPDMLRFFLQPRADTFSEEFIHVALADDPSVRELLGMMAVEYAGQREDAQAALKPLAIALFVHIARAQRRLSAQVAPVSPAEAATREIVSHPESVTLDGLAKALSYHPNYLSGLLRRETGKTFTQLVLEARMERASALLRGSTLPVEDVALLVGYSNPSNFHKAFRSFWGATPAKFRRQGTDAGKVKASPAGIPDTG